MTGLRQPVRVCLLTSWHPIEYSRFFDREAVSLSNAGYDVTLVGLGDVDSDQRSRGVRLIALTPSRGARKLRLLKRLADVAFGLRSDVYQCLDPWTLAIGLLVQFRRPSVRIVYEASEWFPQMYLDRPDLTRIARRTGWLAVTMLEWVACRRARLIIETNRTRSGRFQAGGRQPVIVPNYPPLELLPDSTAQRGPAFAWTGLMSRPRGFDRLLEAMVDVRREYPEVRLAVAGEFDPHDDIGPWAHDFITRNQLAGNVDLLGTLPYARTMAMLRGCAAGVILLQPGRGNDYTGQPNKLFEFMGAGLAVIASDFPEIAPVVRESNCGWLVDPTDTKAIATAMKTCLAGPKTCAARGAAGRAAVFRQYGWSQAETALLSGYRGLYS